MTSSSLASIPASNQQAAIDELRRTNPNYALALSGKNPPGEPPTLKDRKNLFIILMYGIPSLIVLFWIIVAVLSLSSHLIILAIICYLAAAFSHEAGKYERSKIPSISPQPLPMKVQQETLRCDIKDSDVVIDLEYEIPTTFNSKDFENLIAAHFGRIVGAYLDTKLAEYEASCKTQQKVPLSHEYAKILIWEEIEAALVPSFGRAVFEAGVPVFRFKIITEVVPQVQAVAQTRGFIGTSP